MEEGHVALREFIEKQIEAHEKLNEARFSAVERAVDVASKGMDKRLDGMNEFRETLKDQAGQFATKPELSGEVGKIYASINGLRDKFDGEIRSLEIAKAILEGKASQKSVNVAYAIAAIGIIISIVGLVIDLSK